MGEFGEKYGRIMCKEIIKLIKMKLLALFGTCAVLDATACRKNLPCCPLKLTLGFHALRPQAAGLQRPGRRSVLHVLCAGLRAEPHAVLSQCVQLLRVLRTPGSDHA